MKVKIVDVAREANVSVATVSRVVNNVPLVNQETRERVLAAIKRTGYKPNAIARSLKIQRTNTLGMIIPDISNPFYTEIVRGAEDTCETYHYNMILSNTDFDTEKEVKSLNVLVEKQCDGIIYVTKHLSEEMRQELVSAPVEVVLCCVPDETGQLCSTQIDNASAAYDMAKKCLEFGHEKCLIFCDALMEGYINQQRLAGFKKAYAEAGLPIAEDRVFSGPATMSGGRKMIMAALDAGLDFSVILCYNDQIALGAMQTAQRMGYKVPEEISVTGFNDFWISEWMTPAITTISQPMHDLGTLSTRMLIKMCQKMDSDVKSMGVPYELVMRDSVYDRRK